MSGGVDSAVTAALLVRQGYDCIGVTMRLVPEHEGKSPFEPCCGLEAAEDARRVCEKLGIPHQVMHAIDRFDRDIINYFVDEYVQGRTPNPCVRCNRMIKFGALYQKADELGCSHIAMGHYARLEARDGRVSLRRAVHLPKDQSYVLAPLVQRQLRRAHFPLGHLTKEEVRQLAWGLDFRMATKPESMEICFVPDNDYRNVVTARAGAQAPGPILNTRGERLGTHLGLTVTAVAAERADRSKLARLCPACDRFRVDAEHGRDLCRSQQRLRHRPDRRARACQGNSSSSKPAGRQLLWFESWR